VALAIVQELPAPELLPDEDDDPELLELLPDDDDDPELLELLPDDDDDPELLDLPPDDDEDAPELAELLPDDDEPELLELPDDEEDPELDEAPELLEVFPEDDEDGEDPELLELLPDEGSPSLPELLADDGPPSSDPGSPPPELEHPAPISKARLAARNPCVAECLMMGVGAAFRVHGSNMSRASSEADPHAEGRPDRERQGLLVIVKSLTWKVSSAPPVLQISKP
jgi:hypothetical protein